MKRSQENEIEIAAVDPTMLDEIVISRPKNQHSAIDSRFQFFSENR